MDDLTDKLANQLEIVLRDRDRILNEYNQVLIQYRDDLKDGLATIKELQRQRDAYKEMWKTAEAQLKSSPSIN